MQSVLIRSLKALGLELVKSSTGAGVDKLQTSLSAARSAGSTLLAGNDIPGMPARDPAVASLRR